MEYFHISTSSNVNLDEVISDFKKRYGVSKFIAFSGGADAKKDEVEKFISKVMCRLKEFRIAVITGGTAFGVPEIASKEAKKRGIPVIGVTPSAAKQKHLLPDEFLSLRIDFGAFFSESQWGDESFLFAKLCDAAIVVGGGSGTLVEVAHIMKMNERLIKENSGLTPKYVVPALGFSGVSEVIAFQPIPTKVKFSVLPEDRVFTPEQVTAFLIDKLNLYENDN